MELNKRNDIKDMSEINPMHILHNFKESRMKKNLLAVAVLTASAFIPLHLLLTALNITGSITDRLAPSIRLQEQAGRSG